MNKLQSIALINSLYNAIPEIHVSWSSVRSEMFHKCKEAEKLHRKNRPAVKGFSVDIAARYFVVKYLYKGATASYTIENMIDIRHEALLGCAYARRYNEQLKDWLELVRNSQFDLVDYAALME